MNVNDLRRDLHDVIEGEIVLHRSELVPGGNGARIGYSDDYPDRQFLVIPKAPREPRADRNKRVALEAIALLDRAVNESGTLGPESLRIELDALRERWSHVPWVQPTTRDGFDLDDWVTAEEIAAHADVKPGTVRMWHHRGYITSVKRHRRRLYNIGEVVKYQNRRQTSA